MKPYLDTEDTFYLNYEELIEPSKIITNLAELKENEIQKQKSKRDWLDDDDDDDDDDEINDLLRIYGDRVNVLK